MTRFLAVLGCAAVCSCTAGQPAAPDASSRLDNASFRVDIDGATGTVIELRNTRDPHETNYVIDKRQHPEFDVEDSRWLGTVIVRYRTAGGDWHLATTAQSGDVRRVERSEDEISIRYDSPSSRPGGLRNLRIRESFRLEPDALVWKIALENSSANPVEIGDLAIPLLFNSYYVLDPVTTYNQRVVRHHLFSGDHAFAVWRRPDGSGPFLAMTPLAGTRLEYFDRAVKGSRSSSEPAVFGERSGFEGLFTAYVHAAAQTTAVENRGDVAAARNHGAARAGRPSRGPQDVWVPLRMGEGL